MFLDRRGSGNSSPESTSVATLPPSRLIRMDCIHRYLMLPLSPGIVAAVELVGHLRKFRHSKG